MTNCKALPAVRLGEVRKSLIIDLESNRKQRVPKTHWFRCYSARWASSLSQKKIKVICATVELVLISQQPT